MKGGVLAILLLTASVAAADPARSTQLSASGLCDATSFEARSNELLGRTAIDPEAAARVSIVTALQGAALTATLTFVDENGSEQPPREMTAASCDELAESVAIVISLVLRQAAPAAPPPPPPVPVVNAVQDDESYVPADRVPRSTQALELGVAMSSARQSALVVGGRLEYRRTALAADVEVAMPDSVDVNGGRVHVTSARADVAGCLRVNSFVACGLVSGGLVRARGEDLMDGRTAVRPVAGASLRAEWRQPISRRVGLRVFASVEQLLLRPSFLVDDVVVWTTPLLQVWGGGGIFFQMP
jgi:hypothetical protein